MPLRAATSAMVKVDWPVPGVGAEGRTVVVTGPTVGAGVHSRSTATGPARAVGLASPNAPPEGPRRGAARSVARTGGPHPVRGRAGRAEPAQARRPGRYLDHGGVLAVRWQAGAAECGVRGGVHPVRPAPRCGRAHR